MNGKGPANGISSVTKTRREIAAVATPGAKNKSAHSAARVTRAAWHVISRLGVMTDARLAPHLPDMLCGPARRPCRVSEIEISRLRLRRGLQLDQILDRERVLAKQSYPVTVRQLRRHTRAIVERPEREVVGCEGADEQTGDRVAADVAN